MANKAVLSIISILLAAGLYARDPDFCGPSNEKYKIVNHKDRPMPEPSTGKSMIFLFWKGGTGNFLTKKSVAINGRWVTILPGHSYSFVEVEPGVQRICQKDPGKAVFLFLTSEADKTYYVEFREAWREGPGPLHQLPAAEAKEYLAKCKYVTIERKH